MITIMEKKFEEVAELAETMEIEFLTPKFNSDTRFANSSAKVFKTAYRDRPVFIQGYKEIRESLFDSSLQKDRYKANHASDMLRRLNNKKYLWNCRLM